jgi:uncharacterized protein YlaI
VGVGVGIDEELINANARGVARAYELTDNEIEKLYGVGMRNPEEVIKIAEASCMICSRKFNSAEDRILPPDSMQLRDYFVRRGMLQVRYICRDCYDSMASPTRDKSIKSPDFRKARPKRKGSLLDAVGLFRFLSRE